MLKRDRLVLLLFCIVAPFAYSYIMQLWRNVSPLGPAPAFHIAAFTYALAFAGEAIGACFAAVVLSLPLAWLIRSRPLLIAVCLAFAAAITLLPDLFLSGVQLGEYRFAVIQVPALLAFFLVCWLSAKLVIARKLHGAT